MLGPNKHEWNLPALTIRETALLGTLAVMLLWLGLYPKPIFATVSDSLTAIQQPIDAGADGQMGSDK